MSGCIITLAKLFIAFWILGIFSLFLSPVLALILTAIAWHILEF